MRKLALTLIATLTVCSTDAQTLSVLQNPNQKEFNIKPTAQMPWQFEGPAYRIVFSMNDSSKVTAMRMEGDTASMVRDLISKQVEYLEKSAAEMNFIGAFPLDSIGKVAKLSRDTSWKKMYDYRLKSLQQAYMKYGGK